MSGALAGWAERTPDAVAFRFLPAGGEPKALSFAGLNRQVDIIASALASRQEPGSRALLVFKPGLDFIAAFVACLRAGVVAVPLRPPGPRETGGRIAAVIADAGADLILTHGEAASLLTGHALDCPILEVDGLQAPDAPAAGPARHSELALLQYTSGTSGTPKGVMVRHANLMSNIAIMMQRLGVGPGSATVSWLPHYHDMGLVGPILVALVSGNSANLIAPADFLRAPLSWLEAISRYRADMAIGPNFGYELCAAKLLDGGEALDALAIDLSCLRVAVVGAEPVRAATLARFLSAAAPLGFPSQAFFPSYGLAECTLFVDGIQGTLAGTVRRFDAQALKEGKAAAGKERVLVACGMRDGESETSVVIADPDVETVLPDGSIGEVCVSGPGVAAGYWGREAETAAVFDRPIAGAPGHYMRTGDLGFYHEGKLFITGRRDDLIILNGVNHHPQDIEATAASTHLALSAWRAAVVAVEDAGHCRVIALIEIPREARFSLDPEKLIASIREAVFDGHELPLHDVVLLSPGRLPVTSSGKVRRRACRELFQSGEIESLRWRAAGRKREQGQRAAETATAAPTGAASSPATPLDTLREIIAEVSGHPVAEVDASLRMSAQPVDSLKLIQIQLLLESRLGLRLTVESMLAASSLAALAAGLDPFRLPLAAELHADSSLPAEYVPPSEAWEPGGDLLVTGATGMLGAHIVRELIARTSARIHCLVRGRSNESEGRLERHLMGLGLSPSLIAERIVSLPADLTLPRMGVAESVYANLAAQVGIVIHSAAAIDFLQPYASLRLLNVEGSRAILALATAGRAKRILHLSSIGVLQTQLKAGRRLGESEPLEHPETLPVGYAQSKWVADAMMLQARARGFMVSICRAPWILSPDAGPNGVPDGLVLRFLATCHEIGCIPDSLSTVNIVPVDFVSQSIAGLALSDEATQPTYHLGAEDSLPLAELALILRKDGRELALVPLEAWIERLKQAVGSDEQHPMRPFLSLFTGGPNDTSTAGPYFAGRMPEMDSHQTGLLLRRLAIAELPSRDRVRALLTAAWANRQRSIAEISRPV